METSAVNRLDWMQNNELLTSVMISANEFSEYIIETSRNYSAILLISCKQAAQHIINDYHFIKYRHKQFRQACTVLKVVRRLLIYPEDISSLSQ